MKKAQRGKTFIIFGSSRVIAESFSSHKQAGSLFYCFASAITFEEPKAESFSSHKQAGSLFYSFASAITFEEPKIAKSKLGIYS